MAKFRSGVDSAPSEPPRSLLEDLRMSTVPVVEDDSYLGTKRWFKKYPELGDPGIPVEPFTSEDQFARERQRLWPRVWLMVGRAEHIPESGDYFTKAIPPANASLIVVRGRDRVIRAFHNVCSHRGSQLCWESGFRGHTAAFKCPYHGFTYDLEGHLRFVPDEANFYDLDKDRMGLRPVVTDIWEGFIFVHLSPNPTEALKEYLGAITEGLSGYPFHEQNYQYSYRAVLNCNWKLLISSFLEGFHVRTLHAAGLRRFCSTDNPYSHLDFVKLLGKHRLLSLFVNQAATPTKVADFAFSRYKKTLAQLSDSAPGGSQPDGTAALGRFLIRNIFPNFQLNLVMGGWYAYQFWPLTPDTVLWETRMSFSKPRNATEHFFQYYARYASRENLMEDGRVTEQQQLALKSGVIKRLVLQDEEIAVQHFNSVVQSYTADEARSQTAGK